MPNSIRVPRHAHLYQSSFLGLGLLLVSHVCLLVFSVGATAGDSNTVPSSVVRIAGTRAPGAGIVVQVQPRSVTFLSASHIIQAPPCFKVSFAAAPDEAPLEENKK